MSTVGYYLPTRADHFLRRAWRKWRRHEEAVPGFPKKVQIQTKSGCNADCVFCPNVRTLPTTSQGTMHWDLYTKIVDEVVEFRPKRISPYMNNEPLLDRELGKRIRYITDRKDAATRTRINTNASRLDEMMSNDLIDAELDRLNVSFHGLDKEIYEKQMGRMSFEKNLANVNRFLEIKRRRHARKPDVRITMVRTTLVEHQIPRIREYWAERGVQVNVRPLGNMVDTGIEQAGLNPEEWHRFTWCTRMMEQAYILWNGDCVLCCVDWDRAKILGNLRTHTLREVWNAHAYDEVRRRFKAGDVKGLPCDGCSYMRK